ncbi:conserved hypothetical protein [uncultured Desulfobacterium sp.]|uniref:SAP domain-containing protein n=1 Tax=uncultured Desulfobacterium sp. TaxID=201089 RepID=A0A445N1S7_9BACT|nr:conserved hypothetical protein [uncultured Desulfobacterium sp.]
MDVMENKSDQREASVDITSLIRSLQRTEGNADCFRRDNFNCKQLDCSWRPYCLQDLTSAG